MSCALTTVRFLPWWRCSILVHSEGTHGNPPARFPPALQLLPADPADDKVYIHNAALPALHCSLPACLSTWLRPNCLSSPSLSSFLCSLKHSKILASLSFLTPRCFCLPPSLYLSIWQHALTLPTLLLSPFPSRYIRSPSALCFLSLTHTHARRLLFTHSAVCLPPAHPASWLYLFSDYFSPQSVSASISFSLTLSVSVCLSLALWLRPSSSGLRDV